MEREILGEHQDGAEYVFGDGAVENAAGVGDHHIALDQGGKHQRIYSRAGGVNPLQLVSTGPGRFKGFGTEVRDHHDIGTGQAFTQGGFVAGEAYFSPGLDRLYARRCRFSRCCQNGNDRFA